MGRGYAYIVWDTTVPPAWTADAGVCRAGKSKALRKDGVTSNDGAQIHLAQGVGIKEALVLPESQISPDDQTAIQHYRKLGYNDAQARLAVLCRFRNAQYQVVALFEKLPDAVLEKIDAKEEELIRQGKKWAPVWNCGHVAAYAVYASGPGPHVPPDSLTPHGLFDACVAREEALQIEWLFLDQSVRKIYNQSKTAASKSK